MLKLGEKSIKSLYFGGKSYAKAYLGSKLVFNKIKKPYYCEVEYIESTGTQYIDTGIIGNSDTKAELALIISTLATGNVGVFGSRGNSANSNLLAIGYGTSQLASDFNNSSYSRYRASVSYELDTKYICYTSKEERFIKDENGIVLAENTALCNDIISTSNLLLFAETGINYKHIGKIFYAKIWDDNILVRDFIPVLDKDKVPCMYDKVTKQFFYNQGSGEFLYGREIHEVEYIESTGIQYIDTNYIIKSLNHKITIKFGKITGGTTAPYWIAGSQGIGNTRSGGIARITNDETKVGVGIGNIKAGSTTYRTDNPTKLTTMSIVSKDTMKFDWIVDGEVIYKDISFGVGSVSGYSEHIWGLNFRGANGYNAICPISQYQLEDDGILVRDMIPAIDENGKGFMFDRVSHTIFDNQGSGEFIKGKIKC